MAEPVLGPSSAGSVVLELGDTVGVLVLEATAAMNGWEIEISPVAGGEHHDHDHDHDHDGDHAGHDHDHGHPHLDAHGHHPHRTHSMVRERGTAAGNSYAAVYPGVPAGTYTVWRDHDTPAGTVTIDGGRVTRYRWPD
jgi:hypothetical protein